MSQNKYAYDCHPRLVCRHCVIAKMMPWRRLVSLDEAVAQNKMTAGLPRGYTDTVLMLGCL